MFAFEFWFMLPFIRPFRFMGISCIPSFIGLFPFMFPFCLFPFMLFIGMLSMLLS